MEPARSVVFVCLHGAAKSVIAAAAGIDPEPEVPPRVVEALLKDGIDVRRYRRRRATREELAAAWRVVSFGCDLRELAAQGLSPIRWDDVPLVSEDFEAARDAIVARLPSLLDSSPEPGAGRGGAALPSGDR